MKKQSSEPTMVQKANSTVDGFDNVFIRLQQQVTLRGQSKSTLNNYIRRVAAICLYFGKLPQEISEDELKTGCKENCCSCGRKPAAAVVTTYRI